MTDQSWGQTPAPETPPAGPSFGRRVGQALVAFVLFPLAGLPVLAGVAVESAVVAWVVAELRWFGDPGFRTVFAWVLGVQLVPVLLFAVPAWIGAVAGALRTGELPE
jgi:hypothetical protein